MLLELKNIKKQFAVQKGFLGKTQSTVHAVNDINLFLEQGENMGLVGESGCGKSTLARMMTRLVPVTSGTITFDGQDIQRLAGGRLKKFRQSMQMVFQDPYNSLDPRFTIRRSLKEALTLDKVNYRSKSKKEERMVEMLRAVHLNEASLNRYPHEFSGGERQRIAIARALMLNPKLLILDEAVSSLDVLIQEDIIQLLNELKKEYAITYFFISHNLKVVKKISQRIAVMYQGKIVELASSEDIFANPIHPYTKELLAAALDYKSLERTTDVRLHERARLVHRGSGHYVLE